jgi:hypothetical protein
MQAQTLNSKDLAQKVVANEFRQFNELGEFTFEYERIVKRFNEKGKEIVNFQESGESYMSHRRNVDIALVRNGKPLKPKDLDKQQEAATRKLEADAKERQANTKAEEPLAKRPGPGMRFDKVRMSVINVLRYCQLSEPRQATQLEVDFTNCKSPWPSEEHYVHLRGTVSVDATKLVVVSWKAYILDGPDAGALVFEQSTQEAAGGTRVLALNHLNLNGAPNVFPRNRKEVIYRWTKPQRFGVGVEQKIEAPRP